MHPRLKKELVKTGGASEVVDKGQHLFTVGGIVVEYSYYRNQGEGPSKTELVLRQDPPISLLGKYPKGSSL